MRSKNPNPNIFFFKDWCPLCGSRFEATSGDELSEKIINHLTPDKKTGKSFCEKNFRPFDIALADDDY